MNENSWPLPDRKAFVGWKLKVPPPPRAPSKQNGDYDDLFEQQRFCRAYLQHDGPYRGLLLYHGLGSGKTCSAIATAEGLEAVAGRVRGGVYVFVTAALERSYVRQVRLCGARIFRQSQGWRKVTAPDEVERIVASGSWVGPKLVKRLDGAVWVPESTSQSKGSFVEFSKIASEADRDAIDACIDDAIKRTHRFVHYNGLNDASIDALLSERGGRPFDDAIIVIDEAHNFASNLDSGKLVKRVYDALMDARRCKIVLLSGTPLVNQPVELAWLVNLAHGPVRVHEVKIGPRGLDDAMERALNSERCRHVHAYWEPIWNVSRIGSVMIQLLPEGFVRAATDVSGTFVMRDRSSDAMHDNDERRIAETLEAMGLPKVGLQVVEHRFEVLPSDSEAFNAMFVVRGGENESNRLDPKNESLLARRCLGAISYFPGHDESLYPAIRAVHDVRVPLSSRQFSEYTAVRAPEKRAEVSAAKRRGNRREDDNGGVGMRTESRAVCTFVYPESVPRPRRAHMREEGNQAYLDALDAALARLRASDALQNDKDGKHLKALSPKFSSIVATLTDLGKARGGTAIVYSQFRRAEGIDVLAAALDANGFAELRVERDPASRHIVIRSSSSNKHRYLVYSNEDPAVADVVLSLFNDQIDQTTASIRKSLERLGLPTKNLHGELATALLITQSGAEGMNTRNVRQVHIIEPFWHRVRLDQVIGRARRAHSHDALPPKERFVDVYVYSATFTEQQKAITRDTLKDGELTSDEFVQAVADRKQVLLNRVLELMRSVAVDCEKGCWAPPPSSTNAASPSCPLYAADIRDDVANRLGHR
jgi:hypothetical protein